MEQPQMVLTAATHRRHCSHSANIRFPFKSALIFLLFLLIGLFGYPLFSSVLLPQNCAVLRDFLTEIQGNFPDITQIHAALFACLKGETVLFALAFLFTFSYFCDFLLSLSLCYRAFLLGMAFSAADMLFKSGELSFYRLTLFICEQALFSALLLGYFTLSSALSHRLRDLRRRQIPLACLLSLGHILRLGMFLAAVYGLRLLMFLILK